MNLYKANVSRKHHHTNFQKVLRWLKSHTIKKVKKGKRK